MSGTSGKTPLVDDQIKLATALENLRLKRIVCYAMIVGFFIIVIGMFITNGWQNKTVFGAVASILGRTMYPIVNHYFGPKDKPKEAPKSAKVKKP